jgi:hypothetical protein
MLVAWSVTRPTIPDGSRGRGLADQPGRTSSEASGTRPFHDHRGIVIPAGTSSDESWYRAIVVVVAHAK